MPNDIKVCFCVYEIRNLMLRSAVTKETEKPAARAQNWAASKDGALFAMSRTEAASMVGTARRKENSTIVVLLRPRSRPPIMVAAERDTPGTMASA